MTSATQARWSVAKGLALAALCFLPVASPVSAEVMYMVGRVSGTVNGTPVDFGINIKMDMKTGEETATVDHMDPSMGAILRQVTALVTVAGPTGGGTPHGGKNLFQLSDGNFVNSATMYWPSTRDSLELIHRVSYSGGDTMRVSATINGTVPVISGDDPVTYEDFTEIMYWADKACANCKTVGEQVVTTGVGFRGDFGKAQFRAYFVGTSPFPGGGAGKGSTTVYTGKRPPGPVVRSARGITTTYDAAKGALNVHLFNTLTRVEAPQ